ncbi:Aste57867_2813 [Aphanomyces stellatus]|uniref:Aste57867_2813 protein n=1 Tax=Aphanomyces stellatus TaxID=120398 RepID=A0A485KAV9_9STRA|nr:hypothetical protein As57867_002806 [Aphanomyces stellatus]VFT80001.1 Aste57867_2813 [Aphanomyces stellatus]
MAMWLYQAAKQVQEKVQERATSIVAQVQDEAQHLLKTMNQMQTNPVDEIIFEELEEYKAFQEVFDLDMKTDDVAAILQTDEFVSDLHTAMVPEQLSYKEFWTRYYFRQFLQVRLEEEQAKRDEERRLKFEQERELREKRQREADEVAAEEQRLRDEQLAKEMDVQMWKDQVAALQDVIANLEKTEAANESLLVEEYEAKMAQMTIQIDDARATGYEEGIAESEQIIKSMRESSQQDLKEMEAYLFSLLQSAASMPPPPPYVSSELAQAIWSLHNVAVRPPSGPSEMASQAPDATAAELKALRAEHAALQATLEGAQQNLKEMDLWKARAVKMKKLKDESDAAAKLHEEQVLATIVEATNAGVAKGKEEMAAQVATLEAKLQHQAEEIRQLTQTINTSQDLVQAVRLAEAKPAVKDEAAKVETEDVLALEEPRGDDWGESWE